MEKVSIIIATYNGINYLENCLPTVFKSEYANFEVIVCDDASTDDSFTYLTEMSKKENRLKIMRNEKNMGAAKTRNIAVREATGNILIFLDNDTQVEPNWITELIKPIQSMKNVAATQATLVEYDKRDTIQLIGTHLIPHTCWGMPLLKGEPLNNLPKENTPIIALSAAMAIRKDVFKKVHGFDEKLALYTEDLELSLRVWIAGYVIVNAPQAIVYHIVKKIEERKKMHANLESIYYHFAKNSLRTIVKNYSLPYLIYYLPQTISILIARAIIKVSTKNMAALKGTTRGMYWVIQNMSDTLKERKFVQTTLRKTADINIKKQVYTKLSLLKIYASIVPNLNRQGMLNAHASWLEVFLKKIPLSYNGIMCSLIGSDFKTLLDVGTGTGVVIEIINSENKFEVTGVEIYQPYIDECRKKGIYKEVIKCDVREMPFQEKSFDTVICFHVIEHLEKHEGEKLIDQLEKLAKKRVVLAMPVGHLQQDAYDGNEYQKHKSEWFPKDLQSRGYKVIGQAFRPLFGEENIVTKWGPLVASIIFTLSMIIQPLLFIKPEWGVYMFAQKEIKNEI